MRLLKSHPILRLANNYIVDSPQPLNLSYMWNFGSLLAFCLIIQIVTGVTIAFNSVKVELYRSPNPHTFTSVQLKSQFSLFEFLCTVRFVFSTQYIKTMASIVFSKAFFKRSCNNFFTVKTGIIILISLSVSFFIKWIFILCSINFALSDSYTLLSLCTLTTASFVRFFKEFFSIGLMKFILTWNMNSSMFKNHVNH